MLDLRLSPHQIARAEELIKLIKKYPGCCDEIWLNSPGGYPSMDTHRKAAEKMKKAAALFRENGIKVSVQITNTLGHGDFYAATNDYSGLCYDGSPVETMADANGIKDNYCFCFWGEHFKAYVSEMVKIYAAIQPECMWIDDDLRAMHHKPVDHSCFCDNCITRFNQTYGTSFTREELYHEINYGDLIWRERYIKQNREGFYHLAATITQAVMDVSADTQMGYEYGRFFNYLGNDYRYVLDAMHDVSKKPVKTRPGGGFYCDKNPLDMLTKLAEIDLANTVVPDYVEYNCPEIENTPDVFFGKSLEGTCKESSLYLAFGCNALTYAALSNGNEDADYDEELLRWLSKYRPYWDKMIAANKDTVFGGVGVYESATSYKKPLKETDEPFSWETIVGKFHTELMKIGIPISQAQTNAKALVLYPEAVDYMTNDDIRELLKKPVVTDAIAIEKLCERGFGARFGICVEPISTASAKEQFTNHRVNAHFAGKTWKASFYVTNSQVAAYTITDLDGKTEALGEYINIFDNTTSYGCVNALAKTYDEQKNELSTWAVFGYSLWEDITSSAKRNQILNAIDAICANTLPAKLITPAQVVVAPRMDKNAKTVCVSLQSISIGETQPLTLVIRNPKSESFVLTNEDIPATRLSYEKNGDDYIVNLPSLPPWDMVTVFCEY